MDISVKPLAAVLQYIMYTYLSTTAHLYEKYGTRGHVERQIIKHREKQSAVFVSRHP